jgi:mannosyl-oligosaccharide alpha-1,2-mannosidase
MNNAEVLNQILAYIPKINFDKPLGSVSLFETTIRYLGGLLSAYDFVGPKGPLRRLVKPDQVRTASPIFCRSC